VEDTTRAVETTDIIRHFFSETEVEELMKLDATERRAAFFRYWVLKEAYVKSRGIGISFGLDQFTIRFDAGHSPSVDGVEGWQLASHRFSARHELGLAISPRGGTPVTVNWRETSSLLSI
jgi:4'-phosphopantetheinyl transferase